MGDSAWVAPVDTAATPHGAARRPGVRSGSSRRVAATTAPSPRGLAGELEALRDEMRRRHVASEKVFARVHPEHRPGAVNLVDYLTLRRYDLRALQQGLAELGLSSLGRSEEHVLTTLERVLATLRLLEDNGEDLRTEAAVGFSEGRRALDRHAEALLGPARRHRATRILVTMPTEAADDHELVRGLLRSGMDCARINCAHDDPRRWQAMVEHLRASALETGRPCPILMDLPGPKVRTGPVAPGPRVVRLRPRRDALGRPVVPARARLVAGDGAGAAQGDGGVGPALPVDGAWLARRRLGDVLRLRDTRGARRRLLVVALSPGGAEVDADDTTYLATGTRLRAADGTTAEVGALAQAPQALVLHAGDHVTLDGDTAPADPGGLRIGCLPPAALERVRPGERVFFDDGRIAGLVTTVRPGTAVVRVTEAAPGGSRLRAEKGINLPDTDLRLPALGPEDRDILRFVVAHADLVGLSFVQSRRDVADLQRHLRALGGEHLGIVCKVETARGFARLPSILLAAMASERVGVMVARGDLAVECGFERLAEVQEEMLCLCDAAHIPVIWATEVLDRMARTGRPSRPEISDAAMAARAECVMLNKGPHIERAVRALDDVLVRMSTHQHKKAALLRRLRTWS